MENPRYRGGSIPSKIFKVLDDSGKHLNYFFGGGGGGGNNNGNSITPNNMLAINPLIHLIISVDRNKFSFLFL